MSIHHRLERLMQDRRLGRADEEGKAPAPSPIRLKTMADVLTLLEEQVTAVRGDWQTSVLDKARCVGALAATALKAIQVGNLEARVEMLEAVLKERKGNSKP